MLPMFDLMTCYAILLALLQVPAHSQDLFLETKSAKIDSKNASLRRLVSSGGLLGGPPKRALDYAGVELPIMQVYGGDPIHAFAIGDWGGLDGSLWKGSKPPEGRAHLIKYSWGVKPGPSVFPRSRWNKGHDTLLCSHRDFVKCYETLGRDCIPGCGFVEKVDTQPQQLVAAQMKKRAAWKKPKFILNVGDNFYWGGIERNCGTPMGRITPEAKHQFDEVFEGVYSGPGLDGVPWFSVLGNHDWGGRVFNNGWDQQIAYTWASNRWVMPAPYFSQRVEFIDQGFSIDLFFIDSNAMDAKDPEEDPEHNMCSGAYNPKSHSCSDADGPANVEKCKDWFWNLWQKNQQWTEEKLRASKADWQIVTTHFPCGHEAGWYIRLRNMGLDLLVTGHRHDQELWDGWRADRLGGLTCVVTGGGGGISSEHTPVEDDGNWYGEAQYGFYDFEISKHKIVINSIDYQGRIAKSATITPHSR